jgi:hypothetical protein
MMLFKQYRDTLGGMLDLFCKGIIVHAGILQ